MFGFTVIKKVSPAELASALKAIVAPDGLVVPALAEDGDFCIYLADELIDHPHARETFAETGEPEYRQLIIAPVTRQRRSAQPTDAEPTLPTVTKRRGRSEAEAA